MKKILCLFATLLFLICSSFAYDREEFLHFLLRSSLDFSTFPAMDYKNALNLSETERDTEVAFKKLYSDYIDYYNDVIAFFKEYVGESFDYDYIKRNREKYAEYGIGFNIPEGDWCLEIDYTMLLNTPEIPDVWLEWLTLQQKYISKNRSKCLRMAKRGIGCEGGTMTIPEREQAIIDLEKIEQKSDVIASIKSQDYDYIPYTSRELIDTYLMGNDLKPIFDWQENDTLLLNKESIKSFKHFIKHHKDSKYWKIINDYYNRLEQNNFLYSPEINGTLIDELESMK